MRYRVRYVDGAFCPQFTRWWHGWRPVIFLEGFVPGTYSTLGEAEARIVEDYVKRTGEPQRLAPAGPEIVRPYSTHTFPGFTFEPYTREYIEFQWRVDQVAKHGPFIWRIGDE